MRKWDIHRISVTDELSGLRLDHALAASETGISRTKGKKLVDLGGVHVNGRRVRSCSTVLKRSDRIEVYVDHLPLEPYRIDERDILHHDSYLIVLNKPAMVDTQPTHARYKGTLYEALQWFLKDPFRPHQKPDVGMIQRLDRGTSGVIVFSIHPRAHKQMTRIFVEHNVVKRYLALVHNHLDEPEGEIISNLARSRKDNMVRSVSKGGKEAITRYRVVTAFDDCSLVDLELVTGRSHQIRAHMAEQGCPLLGDLRYGGKDRLGDLGISRPLLHSYKLEFKHPVTDQPLDFQIGLPADMEQVVASLNG